MQIRKFLPVLLCPLALASPEPNPLPNRVVPRDSGILADLPQIFDAVKGLLDPNTVASLETIISGGATLLGGDTPQNLQRLLSSQNIDKLQSVIDNAYTLLSARFVNETTTLIDDATPVSLVSTIDSTWTLTWLVGCRCFQAAGRSLEFRGNVILERQKQLS